MEAPYLSSHAGFLSSRDDATVLTESEHHMPMYDGRIHIEEERGEWRGKGRVATVALAGFH